MFAGFAALVAGAVLVRGSAVAPSAHRVVAWSFVASGLVLALPWLDVTDPIGLAFRLRTCAFVAMASCTAIAIGGLPQRARAIMAVVALVVVLAVPRDRRAGEVRAHPSLVAAARALADHVPPGMTLVVGERHVEYMVAWYTRAPVSLRPEPVPEAARMRVVLAMSPIHAGYSLEPALDQARHDPTVEPPQSFHPDHRDGFVLVSERTWAWILAHLSQSARAHWQRWPTI
jgi:hypothetical protein